MTCGDCSLNLQSHRFNKSLSHSGGTFHNNFLWHDAMFVFLSRNFQSLLSLQSYKNLTPHIFLKLIKLRFTSQREAAYGMRVRYNQTYYVLLTAINKTV